MRYFSTFSGIGGFEIGIHRAFEATQERVREESQEAIRVGSSSRTDEGHAELGNRAASLLQHALNGGDRQPHCVGYSEIDKYASSVYERHYPNVRNYGDITKINADELPDFDLLVGGFPCQAFSIAGKRRGFEDTRGTLFFDLARILKAKTPRLFVFENVKGLLSHDGGKTFATIIAATHELGYDCQWQVLNSKNHGVPQNRERIIIVGHLRGTPRPEVFPIGADDGQDTRKLGQELAPTIDAHYYKGWSPNGQQSSKRQLVSGVVRQIGNIYDNGHNSASGRVYDKDGISPTLDTAQGGNRQPKVMVREATKKGYAEATIGDTINITQPNSKTRRGRVQKESSVTLQTNESMVTLTPDLRIRRLTPIECERLQAFPDNWTKYGRDGELISDTQRYKMCGNAVTTNVIRDVMERIFASSV